MGRIARLRPKSGLAHLLHTLLLVALPALVFVLVRINFVQLALALILLSKWRMLAVKPRHWPAYIRANAVDLTVSISFLIFMLHSDSQIWQLVWAVAYGVWLTILKPAASAFMVSAQAMTSQVVGLMALFLHFGESSTFVLTLLAWLVCYVSARHFFTNFDEPLTRIYAYTWGYFAASLTWLLSHWLLFYGILAQPTLLLTVIGFGLATLYYLEQTDRLSELIRRQFIFVMIAVIAIVIAFSDWGDKTI